MIQAKDPNLGVSSYNLNSMPQDEWDHRKCECRERTGPRIRPWGTPLWSGPGDKQEWTKETDKELLGKVGRNSEGWCGALNASEESISKKWRTILSPAAGRSVLTAYGKNSLCWEESLTGVCSLLFWRRGIRA